MSRFTNNVYVNFPGLMNDGRGFNNQNANSHLNDQILKKGSIMSNADYRKYLMNNADKIIETNRNSSFFESSNVQNNIPTTQLQNPNTPSDLKVLYLSREELQSHLYNKQVDVNNEVLTKLK
jgi:hypothetical protein